MRKFEVSHDSIGVPGVPFGLPKGSIVTEEQLGESMPRLLELAAITEIFETEVDQQVAPVTPVSSVVEADDDDEKPDAISMYLVMGIPIPEDYTLTKEEILKLSEIGEGLGDFEISPEALGGKSKAEIGEIIVSLEGVAPKNGNREAFVEAWKSAMNDYIDKINELYAQP